ncbi:hypothetical protein [Halorubrum halodurans]|nr:hypothetical protein [Halorubrum halodurans]
MKEQEIIFKAVSDLQAALPSAYPVRTRGGDAGAGPPLCLLGWDSTRLGENGANPLAGIVRDEGGTATGRELHRYHLMELDVTIRTYDESDRDVLLSDVADAFLPYEYDASVFHDDTTEWEIGDPSPRSNPVVEPDWYEGGLTIRFRYVSRVEQDASALTSTEYTVDGSGV